MKTATARDLRRDFPNIETWLAGGGETLITNYSKTVARDSAAPEVSENNRCPSRTVAHD